MRQLLLPLLGGLLLGGCATPDAGVDARAVHGGHQMLTASRIHTGDGASNVDAMVWDAQGVILATGRAHALRARFPHAEHVDAGDAVVVPGLIDAHGHLMNLGASLLSADLAGAADKAEVIARLTAFARELPEGAWLQGRGWDQNRWPDPVFPTAADLDAAFPDRPVWLVRVDGHAGWANTRAMQLAAARDGAPDLAGDWQPEGSRIERRHGQATGVFVGPAARALIEAAMPAPTPALRRHTLERALSATAAVGLTGVHDMGVSREDLALMRELADEGRLPLRIWAYADGDDDALADLCTQGLYTHPGGRLQMHGVKLFIDGALGSRGAALLAPYSDDAHNHGLLAHSPEAFVQLVSRARDCGVQVATHAIGDRGNQVVLDAYAQVLGEAAAERRWRIEHAQVVAVEDIARFARTGVIASMQPTHATSDMPWAQARVGQARMAGAYAWQAFVSAGVPLALGSDFPVESVDPRQGLAAAVTRQDATGAPPGGWRADQALSATQALHGFTQGAAYAASAEHEVGRLMPGMRADFVVLDADPLTVPGPALRSLSVRATWVDGAPVYQGR